MQPTNLMRTYPHAVTSSAPLAKVEKRIPSATGKIKVLVVDEEMPYPPNSGKRIRTWNLLSRMARNHTITLLCHGDNDDPAVRVLESAGIRVHLVPDSPALKNSHLYSRLFANLFSRYPYTVAKHFSRDFQRRLQGLLAADEFDLVQCEWTPYARACGDINGLPLLIVAHNVESQILLRRSQRSRHLGERIFFYLQAEKMKLFEQRVLQGSDRVAAVSVQDAATMRKWGVQAITLVENGVDTDYYSPANHEMERPEVLFLASLDWHANQDALDCLLIHIMPRVVERLPIARLRIVGRRPPVTLASKVAHLKWAELVGEVEDVRPYLARAAVVAVPLRVGGGSRIKILEAFAAGKAVVSTTVGAEGLNLVNGEHLSIADAPDEFARCTVDLLTSPGKRQAMGMNGRRLVVERYGWDKIATHLEYAWRQTCLTKLPDLTPERFPQAKHGYSHDPA